MSTLANLLNSKESNEDKDLAILIDPAIHARVKTFAAKYHIRMKAVVESSITDALDAFEASQKPTTNPVVDQIKGMEPETKTSEKKQRTRAGK